MRALEQRGGALLDFGIRRRTWPFVRRLFSPLRANPSSPDATASASRAASANGLPRIFFLDVDGDALDLIAVAQRQGLEQSSDDRFVALSLAGVSGRAARDLLLRFVHLAQATLLTCWRDLIGVARLRVDERDHIDVKQRSFEDHSWRMLPWLCRSACASAGIFFFLSSASTCFRMAALRGSSG